MQNHPKLESQQFIPIQTLGQDHKILTAISAPEWDF